MSSDYCALEDIGSIDISKYQRITIENGDGETVFLWSRYGDDPSRTKILSLTLSSKVVLSKERLIKVQEMLVSKGVRGGVLHVIDD